MNDCLSAQVLRFLGVGSFGFVIDGGGLWCLLLLGFDPYIARFISFPVAVTATWWLNRIWTFAGAGRTNKASQFGRYLSVQVFGAISNYVVYAAIVSMFGSDVSIALSAFAVGSAVGMITNFVGAKYYAFKA